MEHYVFTLILFFRFFNLLDLNFVLVLVIIFYCSKIILCQKKTSVYEQSKISRYRN